MALETSPESPAAVRTISRILADWIGRLGAVWIDGQVAEYRPRPGARLHYFVLRDTDVDMSLSVKADAMVIGRLDPPLAEGQRVLIHAKPDFYAGRGSLSMWAKEIRPIGIGALLAELARLKDLLAAEGLFAPERKKAAAVHPDEGGPHLRAGERGHGGRARQRARALARHRVRGARGARAGAAGRAGGHRGPRRARCARRTSTSSS